jgi:methyl-accepting chemotaxis protein
LARAISTLEQFPGKKAFINDTIEALRGNLRSIIGEVSRLIAASTEGMLDVRGDDNRFVGDFAQLIVGINGMLDAILDPITEGNRVLELVSTGNLTQMVEIDCHGDHQKMKNAINRMVENLRHFAENIGDAASQVSSGSNELASSSQQLSEGATEQAASTEQASASMERWPPTSSKTPTTRPRPRRSPCNPPRMPSCRARPSSVLSPP